MSTVSKLCDHEARFWHHLQKSAVQCDLCHHYCRLRDGAPGMCRTRINKSGTLCSLNYGHPAAIALDPVEKKPLYHFMPGTLTFSIGTFGCNFRCDNCQNWEISQFPCQGSQHEQMEYTPERVVREARNAGASSVSCTYSEPTVFAEYAFDIMKLAKKAGLGNIWVSNGYMSDICMKELIPLLDAVNIDLKSVDEAFYRRICKADLAPVLKNIELFARSGVHLELSTLLIPGYSDDMSMLQRAAEFIVDAAGPRTPWHLLDFVPEISWRMQRSEATRPDLAEDAARIAKQAGLTYIYSRSHRNTHCPECGRTIIERNRYAVRRHDHNGQCPACRTVLPVRDA
jgi:pyruvate formate lyase activating enzyme